MPDRQLQKIVRNGKQLVAYCILCIAGTRKPLHELDLDITFPWHTVVIAVLAVLVILSISIFLCVRKMRDGMNTHRADLVESMYMHSDIF